MHHYETRSRSLVKTIVWRIIATLVTWGTLYFFTHDLSASTHIALVAAAISMVMYYLHERAWNAIHWGKKTDE